MAEVNDVVLIYLEDSPVSFARVESILPDNKKDWYHIRLLMLQIPLQEVTWILKDAYINGADFHMNGKKMRMEKVKSPKQPLDEDMTPPQSQDNQKTEKESSNVISFANLKKKHDPEND